MLVKSNSHDRCMARPKSTQRQMCSLSMLLMNIQICKKLGIRNSNSLLAGCVSHSRKAHCCPLYHLCTSVSETYHVRCSSYLLCPKGPQEVLSVIAILAPKFLLFSKTEECAKIQRQHLFCRSKGFYIHRHWKRWCRHSSRTNCPTGLQQVVRNPTISSHYQQRQ
jgi:hypothetical protein